MGLHGKNGIVGARCVGLLVLGFAVAGPSSTAAQIPDEFTNLQVLPEDIERGELIGVMRGFSLDLGVRCQYCHIGGDGRSFEGVEFDKDDDPDKRKARFMLSMVKQLNEDILPEMPDRDDPPLEMTCKNCHRGQAKPHLLTQDLAVTLEAEGVEAAVARYKQLRQDYPMSGAFDFGEWEVNLFAESLVAGGQVAEGVAIYELNQEFFPESPAIPFSLGQAFEQLENIEAALAAYERVLELVPDHGGARARVNALSSG